jgi:hypothetical protein
MTLTNGDFEDSPDFTGWTKTLSSNNLNNAQIVTSYASGKKTLTGSAVNPYIWTPKTGTRFLRIGAGDSAVDVWQTVSQNITLTAGDIIAGWAAFDWEDNNPRYDGARVRLYQGPSATPTFEVKPFDVTGQSFPNPNPPPTYLNYYDQPWTEWSWVCTADGVYTIELGVKNTYESRNGSFALFDAIAVTIAVTNPSICETTACAPESISASSMQIVQHSLVEFASSVMDLLPPGSAWRWPAGGFGESLLLALSSELKRVEQAVQGVLDRAINLHKRTVYSWNLCGYRFIVAEAIAEAMPGVTFPHAPVCLDHLLYTPLQVGSVVGDGVWSAQCRYILRVRYYSSLVDLSVFYDALSNYRQAHVNLWLEDMG